MTEDFLQYVWQHRLMPKRLFSVDGRSIEVEKPGEHNLNAGPDFLDSRLLIDGIHWAGNVEVHIKTSDWDNHKHQTDKKYNNVVLHVVYEHDKEISLENGEKPLTLELKNVIPQEILDRFGVMSQCEDDILCRPFLKEIPSFMITGFFERLVVERLQRKTSDVERLLKESNNSWEDCCYWLLARYMGGKVNAAPFEMLAKSTPMKCLGKIKDNAFKIEALLMGQSGLLEGDFADEYPRSLKKEYEYLRGTFGLKPMEGYLWNFFRVRPSSFPTLRISQFANLIFKSTNLFSKLLNETDLQSLRSMLTMESSEYWDTHYRFDKESRRCKKNFGSSSVDGLIINSWIPLLFHYGVCLDKDVYKNQA